MLAVIQITLSAKYKGMKRGRKLYSVQNQELLELEETLLSTFSSSLFSTEKETSHTAI